MSHSHRPLDILQTAVEFIDSGRPFAMAVVLAADGSTPQKAGVRALIDASGAISGTVGGGQVEAEVQRRAVEACRMGRTVVFDLHLDGVSAAGEGAICGGAMRILIDAAAGAHRAALARAVEALRERRRGVLLTRVDAAAEPQATVRWLADGVLPPETGFPGAAAVGACLARETPCLFREDPHPPEAGAEVLVEPVIPEPRLLIVGGGHVGQALAAQAVLVGFDVTVLDDRAEFTHPALFPEGTTTRCGDVPEEVARFPMAGDTYVVLVTRGHRHDAEALEACIRAPAAYVGMIGSVRKVAMIRDRFLESGVATEADLNRVFAPVGLDIGAVTVPEIATSITAQLVAVRRKGRVDLPRGHGGR